MKILVLISCALSVASAAISYHGPIHHPIIHDGVPVEPPEVQKARAEHIAALAEASSQAGYYHEKPYHQHHQQEDEYKNHHHHSGTSFVQFNQHVGHSQPVQVSPNYKSNHIQHFVPIIGYNGVPLDTPEVEAAKAHHFAAVNKALAQVATSFRHRRSLSSEHIPIIDKHGVPVEPFEVQNARAEHLAHHAATTTSHYSEQPYSHHDGHSNLERNHHGYTVHIKHAPVYGHHYEHHSHFVPKYDYHGHPLDTEEVEHLKTLHFAAHAKLGHHY